jgi:hypothetical protein
MFHTRSLYRQCRQKFNSQADSPWLRGKFSVGENHHSKEFISIDNFSGLLPEKAEVSSRYHNNLKVAGRLFFMEKHSTNSRAWMRKFVKHKSAVLSRHNRNFLSKNIAKLLKK